MTSQTVFPAADAMPPVRLPPGGPWCVTTASGGGAVRPGAAGAAR
ncbi:hypothetical protein [Streptomyces sp. NPDC056844]